MGANSHRDRPSGLAHTAGSGEQPSLERKRTERLERFRERALARGVNPVLYWAARIVLLPSFLVYFRLRRIGREHLPRSGPLLLAANHRSFLDPFVIGTLTRRPVYYVAKRELFDKPWRAWLLNALGAFPIDRGRGDEDAIATAREILARGDCVAIFPEGTRVRSGPLGAPRRGIGRLALETGAPVVPVAVIGTEDVRRGWRVRPRRVRIRCGAPLRAPSAPRPTPALSAAMTERIWARVNLQWEWLQCPPTPHSGRRESLRAPLPTRMDREPRAAVDREPRAVVDREARAAVDREARAVVDRKARAVVDGQPRAAVDGEARAAVDREARAAVDREARAA